MPNTTPKPPVISTVVKPAVKPKVLGTMPVATKEKPHIEETDTEKKSRKARIIQRRKGSKK